jgi:cell wall-associated NlpC family hydrolase
MAGPIGAIQEYLLNYLAHGRDLTKAEGRKIVDQAAEWKDTPYATAGTKLAGAAAVQGVGADCSGSTCKIYDQVGVVYKYKSSGQFAAAAAQEGFPFRQLSTNEAPQVGDVILFKGHMAIYSGSDAGDVPQSVERVS